MNKKIRTVAALALVAMLLPAITSCGGGGKKGSKKKKAKAKDSTVQVQDDNESKSEKSLFAVNTYRTKASDLDDYLEFGGDVNPTSSVAVMPDMAGKVRNIKVEVGDTVSRGAVLAYVDPSLPGLDYNLSPVRAPRAGRIISFIPNEGAMVSQGTVIAQIATTDNLEIKVSIPERFISYIENPKDSKKEKQKATVTFDAYQNKETGEYEEFEAEVFEVSPVLDMTSRTMNIKLRFTEPNEKIKVGMFGRVRLVTESIKDAIVVPSNAIITRDGKPYLFVVSGSTVKLTSITKGITVDNKTEIREGISAGAEVVIKGQNLLDDGAQVNVISTSED